MRGGARAGKIGKQYSNRSDLAAKTKLPVTVGPSQYYGQAADSARAQQAVPMGNPAVAPPAQPGAAPTGWQPGQPSPLGAALAGNPINPLHAPTQRPNEPLTAGLPSGPGPGPEAFGPPPFKPDPAAAAKALLSTLPSAYVTPQIKALRDALAASANNANSPSVQLPNG